MMVRSHRFITRGSGMEHFLPGLCVLLVLLGVILAEIEGE